MIKQIYPPPSSTNTPKNLVRENIVKFPQQKVHIEKKSIEIITVPKVVGQQSQKNVAITINTKLIKTILSKVYTHVRITEIVTLDCWTKLAKRKPELVFSVVKYC